MSGPDHNKGQNLPNSIQTAPVLVGGHAYTPSMAPPGLNTPYDIPSAELSHFHSNAWAKSLLASSIRDGAGEYFPIATWSRVPKPSTGEDGFFSQTLATPSTVPFVLTLRRKDIKSATASLPKEPPVIDPKQKKPFKPSRPPDTITLITLAYPGVCGHANTAHGGLVASLFDEVMSLAVALHMPPSSNPSLGSQARDGLMFYTAQLDVRYKRPVVVPGLLVIRTWCVAHDGRKYWTFSQAMQEEEEEAGGHLEWAKRKTVRAEGSALWIEVPLPSSKL
jgi:acyl-coenzyme A thioesterase PaaI-like protein